MRSSVILAISLALIWMGLSGYFTPMLLGLGAVSIGFVLWMAARMRILDEETAPYLSVFQSLSYFTWLFGEIVKANLTVLRAIMSPDLEISPTLVKIPTPQKTDIGRVNFANSITLTPGTISLDIADEHILVHALLAEMANPDDFKEMAARSAWAIGEQLETDT